MATSSISAVLHLGVCEMWLLGVGMERVAQGRDAPELSFVVFGMGCGETDWEMKQ